MADADFSRKQGGNKKRKLKDFSGCSPFTKKAAARTAEALKQHIVKPQVEPAFKVCTASDKLEEQQQKQQQKQLLQQQLQQRRAQQQQQQQQQQRQQHQLQQQVPSPPPYQPNKHKRPKLDSSNFTTSNDRNNESNPAAAVAATATPTTVTSERYDSLGGVDKQIEELRRVVEFPLRYPQVFQHLGADPPAGVLLHGPPGCGKTKLCHAIAGEIGLPFFKISAPEIVAGISGESEQKVRTLFQAAMLAAPCIIFFDEIDAIAGKRESAQRDMERRIVAQLLTCMDDLQPLWREQQKIIIVLAATNRPDSLDPALRRAGRFDREICLGIPNTEGRHNILKVLTKRLTLSGDFDLQNIAFRTPGFVGADLHAVTKEASACALHRIFDALFPKKALTNSSSASTKAADGTNTPAIAVAAEEQVEPATSTVVKTPAQIQAVLAQCSVTMTDFLEAVTKVQPSAMREGFTTIPSVTWEDVGALDDIKAELINNISKPILHPAVYRSMGCLGNPIGVLLYGPPGCGKTLVAKAIAAESGANFISIKGPELLNKYLGETERAVRTVFARASASAPCILFFDELDALAPRRGNEGGNQAAERVVNQLLTELDGVKTRQGVYVIAASNRIDMIDPAMLRPGRLDKMLFVPLPDTQKRIKILQTLSRTTPFKEDVDIEKYASDERCNGFSGADLSALLREAATAAVTEYFTLLPEEGSIEPPNIKVGISHLEIALTKLRPSVTEKDRLRYDRMRSSVMT